jgi:hypothetical protein
MELKFKVQTKIQKPVSEVFDAVYNPSKLSGYFTNGGASAPLDEGTTVEWAFADNPGDEKHRFPVKVTKVIPNELIELSWEGAKELFTKVEMQRRRRAERDDRAHHRDRLEGNAERPEQLLPQLHGLVADAVRNESICGIRDRSAEGGIHRALQIFGASRDDGMTGAAGVLPT